MEDKFRFVTFVITYAAILVQFILSFLPDPKTSRSGYQLVVDDQEVGVGGGGGPGGWAALESCKLPLLCLVLMI